MRTFLALVTCLGAFVSTVAVAADNLAAGTWKLNTAMSTLKGCPSSMINGQTLTVPSDIAFASPNPRTAKGATQPGALGTRSVISRTDVSPDGRLLTLTPASVSECKIVYEKQ